MNYVIKALITLRIGRHGRHLGDVKLHQHTKALITGKNSKNNYIAVNAKVVKNRQCQLPLHQSTSYLALPP